MIPAQQVRVTIAGDKFYGTVRKGMIHLIDGKKIIRMESSNIKHELAMQYSFTMKSKNTGTLNNARCTHYSEADALRVLARYYGSGFDIIGLDEIRPAHYVYGEVDATDPDCI